MTLTLKEGRRYRLANKAIIGPMAWHADRVGTSYEFSFGAGTWAKDGKYWPIGYEALRIISEVPAPRKRRNAKGRREVVRWCFLDSVHQVHSYNTREMCRLARAQMGKECSDIVRIELPAPKGKK